MATIADTGGTNPKDFDRGDNVRLHKFAAMTPGDTSAVIDTTGFDYMIINVGEGTLSSSGTTTFSVRASIDVGLTANGAVETEIGIHAPASAATVTSSRVMGYLSKLPRYAIIHALGGTGTSLDVWVELRKTNVHAKGR